MDGGKLDKPDGRIVDAGVPAEVIPTQAKPARSARRVSWFLLIGGAAAAVHWSTVVLLVEHAGVHPLGANVLGWLLAVGGSFTGHHLLTFGGHNVRLGPAAMRYLALSATGFAINEAAYAALLRWGGQRYDLLLAVVLVGVAAVTYQLGRSWVFAGNRRP